MFFDWTCKQFQDVDNIHIADALLTGLISPEGLTKKKKNAASCSCATTIAVLNNETNIFIKYKNILYESVYVHCCCVQKSTIF